MKAYHALEWIDHLISIELDPASRAPESFSSEATEKIKERIETEEHILMSRLKQRVFKSDEVHSQGLVKKYHDALVLMIGKNYDHLHDPRSIALGLEELHEFIGKRLEGMLKLFEREFSAFLSEENRMPLTRLAPLQTLIQKNRVLMKKKLSSGDHGTDPVDIVMEVFDDFTGKIDARLPVTIREANYIKELLADVLALEDEGSGLTTCPALNELLIYWNLNSKSCIRYFTFGVETMLNSYETTESKVEFLWLEYKKLQIIPEKQNFILNPEFPSVKTYCADWLNNEILYRERRLEGFAPIKEAEQAMKERAFKVMVYLSIDQIGLIIRGAEETQLLKARSKSAVFKAITPYISTPNTEDLKWDNVRTKSYVAEETDKAVVIDALQQVIGKVREY